VNLVELVCAHPPGSIVAAARSLGVAERQMLARTYHSATVDPDCRALLRAIWRARLWIACDCRPSSQAAPLLYVRRSDPIDYVLVPMPERPPHAPACAFCPTPNDLKRDAHTRFSRLDEIALQWVNAAKLNVVYPYAGADLLHRQFLSLREAAKSVDLTAGRRLYECSRTHIDGLPELLKRVLARKPLASPFPQAVFLTTVPAIDGDTLAAALGHPDRNIETLTEQVRSQPVFTLGDIPDNAGPYLVLFALGVTPHHAHVVIEKIFAQPIYSRRLLVPLLGVHERSTLTLLLAVQQELLRTHRSVLVIRRLLPPSVLH
jgi:hypothetical protein